MEVVVFIFLVVFLRGVEEGVYVAVRFVVEVERLLRGYGGVVDECLFCWLLCGLLCVGLVRGLRCVCGLRGWWWEGVLKRCLWGVLVIGVLMRRVGGE